MDASPPLRFQGPDVPRLGRREQLQLAFLAAAGPLLAWLSEALSPAAGFNDFNSYWLAGGLLDRGLSPYDLDALAALGRETGRSFVLGTGYSYPLPFAVAMVPLSRLPFEAALAMFLAGSIVLFALAVAGWLRWASGWAGVGSVSPRRLRAAALAAGWFPPVAGTVVAGQVNLVVIAALALGVRWLVDLPARSGARRARSGVRRALAGACVAAATVVKLVPIVILAPLVLSRRLADTVSVVAGTVALLALAVLVAPTSTGAAERMLDLMAPDPYWTNVSINGFISRLVVSTDRTAAVAPAAFEPQLVTALATGVFAAATLVVLWRARTRLREPRTLALAIGFALLAGVIGAPKNSFWNTSLSIVTVGLLLLAESWLLVPCSGAGLDRPGARAVDWTDRLLLAIWLAGLGVQTLVWIAPPPPTTIALAPIVTLAGSTALYGMLALWWLIARRLASKSPPSGTNVALS
jgi:hypothetical protein